MLNSPPKKIRLEDMDYGRIFISSGGIGTGYVQINKSGYLHKFNINSFDSKCFDPVVFFAVMAETKDSTEIFVLGDIEVTSKYDLSKIFNEYNTDIKSFKFVDSYVNYPFFEATISDDEFSGNIHLTSFSPFIPNNEFDSGIPSVLFEFTANNNTSNDVRYTFYAFYENSKFKSENKLCTTRKNNIKYIFFEDSSKSENRIYTDICIGANGNEIDCIEEIFINTGKSHESVALSVLSSSVNVKPADKGKVRFAVSWYSPCYLTEDNTIEKSYYSRYFSGANECVFYCLSQWERLFQETDNFRQLLYGSTLNYELLIETTKQIENLIVSYPERRYEGYFNEIPDSEKCKCIAAFFPRVFRSIIESGFKSCISIEKKLILINYLYSYLKISGDLSFVESVWKSSIGELCNYINNNGIISSELRDMLLDISSAVKDRKRFDYFSNLQSDRINNSVAKKQLNAFECIQDICNLDIDVFNRTYILSPKMEYSEKGVFQCIICFGSFLGYVERGIDYVQIKSISGTIYIRNIQLPSEPLKVKCGGFEIGFQREDNTALLDNDCEISPTRDLLVIIRS